MILLLLSILVKTNPRAAAFVASVLPASGISILGIRVVPQRVRSGK
jgi:hypothetical protein